LPRGDKRALRKRLELHSFGAWCKLGMKSIAAAAGNKLCVSDLPRQVLAEDSVEVQFLGDGGQSFVQRVGFAPLWRGRGWETVLACPVCYLPARVLTLKDEVACCSRCFQPPRASSRRHQTNAWTMRGAALADQLCRLALRGTSVGQLATISQALVSLSQGEAEKLHQSALDVLEVIEKEKPL
jgi:hypothetical protein